MPARAVEHQDDVLVGAGADLGGERGQERAEQGGVDAVGDEPHELARGWSDEAVQIKPLVAVMAAGGQPRGAQTLRRIGFRPRRCSSNAQTSIGIAVSEPWSSLTGAFFKPGLLVQAGLGIGGPRQLPRQVQATQVFDPALRRHFATDPPADPARHLAPSPPSGGGSLSRNASSWASSSSGAAPGLSSRPSPSPARPW